MGRAIVKEDRLSDLSLLCVNKGDIVLVSEENNNERYVEYCGGNGCLPASYVQLST